MKVLRYALVLAVVFGATMATAQEADKKVPTQQRKEAIKERLKQAAPQHRKILPSAQQRGDRGGTSPAVWQAPKTAPRERLVYRLSNVPASEVARTVNELLKSERAVPGPPKPDTIILSEMISNSLIISGTPDAIQETVKLVEQLDAEPLMVCVQAVIGLVESREGLSLLAPNPGGPELSCSHEEACQLIEEFSKSDAVKILARPQIMTLNNQPASLQIGHRVPRAVITKDGSATMTALDDVGLIVGLTPRIADDGTVTMEIDLEKSELTSEEEGVPLGVDSSGNVVRSPKTNVMIIETTVKIPPSRAVIIGGLTLQDGDKYGELVLVVTPHVVKQKK